MTYQGVQDWSLPIQTVGGLRAELKGVDEDDTVYPRQVTIYCADGHRLVTWYTEEGRYRWSGDDDRDLINVPSPVAEAACDEAPQGEFSMTVELVSFDPHAKQNREEPVSDPPPSAIKWHTHNAKLGEFLLACHAFGAEVLNIDYTHLRVRVDAPGFRKLHGESFWDEVLDAPCGRWELHSKRGDVTFWATEPYESGKSRRVRTEAVG